MTPRDLVYWLRGFLERAGVDPWGPSHTASVRKHAALTLADHPRDSFAMTVAALADQPVALDAVVKAHAVNIVAPTADIPTANIPTAEHVASLAEMLAELRKAQREFKSSPAWPVAPWPILYC